jgi:hypothetical protein
VKQWGAGTRKVSTLWPDVDLLSYFLAYPYIKMKNGLEATENVKR